MTDSKKNTPLDPFQALEFNIRELEFRIVQKPLQSVWSCLMIYAWSIILTEIKLMSDYIHRDLPGLHEKKRPFELTTYRIPPLQNILWMFSSTLTSMQTYHAHITIWFCTAHIYSSYDICNIAWSLQPSTNLTQNTRASDPSHQSCTFDSVLQ